MAYMEFHDVSFTYPNGSDALKNVSLQIDCGEIVAVLGQNGAGKTTLAKLMNGLLKPTAGTVLIGGNNTKMQTVAQISRHVAYAFQNPGDQIFNKDVYSEIAFGPRNLRLDSQTVEKQVQNAAKLCRIQHYLDTNSYDLPLSVRKFVVIASIVAMDSDVIILDEPTAGQDRTGLTTLSQIIGWLSQRGKTIIVITHDMEFVTQNFNRCILMANQKLIADTDKKALFSNGPFLSKAGLKPLRISEFCKKLGLPETILNHVELADYLNKYYPYKGNVQNA